MKENFCTHHGWCGGLVKTSALSRGDVVFVTDCKYFRRGSTNANSCEWSSGIVLEFCDCREAIEEAKMTTRLDEI